ncbi:MAG: RNA pseudouridine synthase [Flavobacteriaceae bacterium]|nr:MAG: RNA pseudouridine synthase [Flavobacteriaceae bacterium]
MASTVDTLEVLYEDNHLVIVNKKAGDIVQGDKTGDTPLSDIVKLYIKKKYNKPGDVFLGVAHRLDRPTTGVIIFARTSKALERLNKMLREHEIKKTYWALVKQLPPLQKDTLVHFLKKNPKNNKSTAHTSEINESKRAVLHYNVLKSLNTFHLLEVDLETGRHHQIRCQLSKIGSPIKGDLKYGFARSNKDASISLHARHIQFIHPVKKEPISVTAPCPNDVVWKACEKK